jgi:hypothetical protein
MKSAIASDAIVSSIFPEVVRDRLYQSVRPGSGPIHPQQETTDAMGESIRIAQASSSRMHPKHIMQNIAHRTRVTNSKEVEASIANGPLSKGFDLAKPIADLFTDCTVFFADIAGFTAWSSQRKPDQVFLLLQNLYQSFDEVARKLRVFKVETIGDCYLAVTGLPDPQADHAVQMTRLAREVIRKMKEVTRALEVILGPEVRKIVFQFCYPSMRKKRFPSHKVLYTDC